MPGAASWFFILYAVTVLISRLFAGRIQDRRGDNAIMYPVLVVFAAGMAMLALEPTTLTIGIAALLTGLGFGALMPCAQTIAVLAVNPRRNGSRYFDLLPDAGFGRRFRSHRFGAGDSVVGIHGDVRDFGRGCRAWNRLVLRGAWPPWSRCHNRWCLIPPAGNRQRLKWAGKAAARAALGAGTPGPDSCGSPLARRRDPHHGIGITAVGSLTMEEAPST